MKLVYRDDDRLLMQRRIDELEDRGSEQEMLLFQLESERDELRERVDHLHDRLERVSSFAPDMADERFYHRLTSPLVYLGAALVGATVSGTLGAMMDLAGAEVAMAAGFGASLLLLAWWFLSR